MSGWTLSWRNAAARRAALLLIGLTLGGPVAAQALSCRVPDRVPIPWNEAPRRGEAARTIPIGGYLLALSWSPEHCATSRKGARDAMQCGGRDGRFGFVLHGLWPQGQGRDWPQWCRPARLVPRPVLREHLCMTPSVQLMQHAWAKHGTCMAADPARYFKAASILYRAVRFPDMSSGAIGNAGDLRRAFAAANRGLPADAVAVHRGRGGTLREVRLCLDRRMRPERCPPHARGDGDRAKLAIEPVG